MKSDVAQEQETSTEKHVNSRQHRVAFSWAGHVGWDHHDAFPNSILRRGKFFVLNSASMVTDKLE